MPVLEKLKKGVKTFLQDPSVAGRQPTTFDFFVDEVGRLSKKVSNNPILKTIFPEEKDPFKKTATMGLGSIGPTGAIKREIGKTIAEEGAKRAIRLADVVKKILPEVNPMEVVKIRQRGNSTIKITAGELGVMKNLSDLKPSFFNYSFQNPIRVFEQLGEGAKELFYRPVKIAEGLAIKTKNFWNQDFDKIAKGVTNTSSKRIMQFAVSQEKKGERLLKGIEIPKLTTKEQEVYQYIRTRYDDLLGQLNEARAIVGKTPINKVENYMTHIRDLNILEQMGFSPITDDIETLLANKVHRNTTAFQWAKRRFNALDDIEWDALNVFRKYQEKALNHINLTPAIVKVRELSRTIIPDRIKATSKFFKAKASGQSFDEWVKGQGETGIRAFHGSPRELKDIGFGEGVRSNAFMGNWKKEK